MTQSHPPLRRIAELLGLRDNSKTVLAITGSGGKTSLAWLLARHFRRERVLVTTSTKMMLPAPDCYDYFPGGPTRPGGPTFPNFPLSAKTGITFAGVPLEGEAKTVALPPEDLAALIPRFDKVFIEADGSRRRPYKGWEPYEPVLPPGLDLTVAMLPVPSAGLKVTAECVHRLPAFLNISGASLGRLLEPEHLAAMIAHPQGLLAKSGGRLLLFFNQADDVVGLAMAMRIADMLPPECKKRLWRIVAGSVRGDRGLVL